MKNIRSEMKNTVDAINEISDIFKQSHTGITEVWEGEMGGSYFKEKIMSDNFPNLI